MTVEIVLQIGNIILIGLGVIVAFQGLNTWKKQLHGNDKYIVSRKLLKKIYEFRDRLQDVRNPLMYASEHGEIPNKRTYSEEYYRVSGAYQKRIDKVINIREELYGILLDAEVLWGNNFLDSFKNLFNKQHILVNNIRKYLESIRNNSYSGKYDENIIYSIGDEEDVFGIELQEDVKKIEDFLKPNMK